MLPRYAIYYTPPLKGEFWAAGSSWLGRDASNQQSLVQASLPDLASVDIDRLTDRPRRYGFHATLKAPFELKSGLNESALVSGLADIASKLSPFTVPLKVKTLGEFIALRPQENENDELRALHEICVRDMEPFRAPLTLRDIERRRKAGLSREQDKRMLKWGYPYIFEDFRFHMTLTCRVRDASLRDSIQQSLDAYFAPHLTNPHRFDGVAVFKQDKRLSPFYVLERVAFGAKPSALSQTNSV